MQQTIVRAQSAADFLALVPRLTGMRPVDSLVLVAFTGRRTAGAMRFDLPESTRPTAIARFANRFVGAASRIEGVDGIVPVVYTSARFATSGGVPHAALLEALDTRGRRAGLHVKDLLCVAADGWGSPRDKHLPGSGHPLSELEAAEQRCATSFGRPPLLDPEAAAVLPAVTEDEASAFARAVAEQLGTTAAGLQQRRTDLRALWRADASGALHSDPDVPIGEPHGALLALLQGHEWEAIVEAALGFQGSADDPVLDADEGQAVLAAIADLPVVRDLVLLQAGWGRRFGRHVREQTLDEPPTADGSEAIILAFSGGDMARPDPERVEHAIRRLVEAAARTAEPERAPLLTMLAWLHWSLGRGSAAGVLTAAALTACPDYPFADLMRLLLANGRLPEWSFHRVPETSAGRRWMTGAA